MRTAALFLFLLTSGLAAAQDLGAFSNGSSFASSTADAEFLPVDEAYRMDAEFTADGLRVFWQIADGYYLYRHRLGFKLTDSDRAVEASASVPSGLSKTDEYFGEVEVYYTSLEVPLAVAGEPAAALLEVKSQGCADAGLCYPPQKRYLEVDFEAGTINPGAAPAKGPIATNPIMPAAQKAPPTLPLVLLFAFLGGAILNLMPCVFPVLSLKVLSFTHSSDHDRHTQGWIYSAGVVASFVLIAALLIALQQAGQAVGWGFQLQSPHFVIALAYLFAVMGLMLSGVIEIGGGWMGAGQNLTEKSGWQGSFFTGVLAVVVASPCTAPFMGTALGYAISQPPAIALLVFAALGAGMAAPMLLLSYSRTLRTRMPKPGLWMDTFKHLMAFPLYATAIWLLWVVGRQTSVDTMAMVLAGLLLVALGLWLWQYRTAGRWAGAACLALAIAIASAAPGEGRGTSQKVLAAHQQPWSQGAMEDILARGGPVFIDFTADWCITCIANERAVLHRDDIENAFTEAGIAYMVADWTNYDEDIGEYLRSQGRNGIPFYVLYTGRPGEPPLVLPQLLTTGIVLEAIGQIKSS